MTRATVMAPAIELAEKGFTLQQGDVNLLNSGVKKFKEQRSVAAIFLKDGKTPYKVGDRLVQQDLAQTLKLIAKQGSDAFYKGAITSLIVKASNQNGGMNISQAVNAPRIHYQGLPNVVVRCMVLAIAVNLLGKLLPIS